MLFFIRYPFKGDDLGMEGLLTFVGDNACLAVILAFESFFFNWRAIFSSSSFFNGVFNLEPEEVVEFMDENDISFDSGDVIEDVLLPLERLVVFEFMNGELPDIVLVLLLLDCEFMDVFSLRVLFILVQVVVVVYCTSRLNVELFSLIYKSLCFFWECQSSEDVAWVDVKRLT